jgi:formate dehydrogenase subunit gamma
MSEERELIRRFGPRHIVNHIIMVVCFTGLVLTGMPQKWPGQGWAKAIVLLFGGVERIRFIHHLLGTAMALQLAWHAIEIAWVSFVRRLGWPMLPSIDDVTNFYQQVKFNLGLAKSPPRMGRYTFAEKLEYLALIWGTVLMVGTGIILLYPVRWSPMLGGEIILAAKAAHGGEAILAFLSIVTWHAYFVHFRHWNTSMWFGTLDDHAYAEEHPAELEKIRRGEVAEKAPLTVGRMVGFGVVAAGVVGVTVLTWVWLRIGVAGITTIVGRG